MAFYFSKFTTVFSETTKHNIGSPAEHQRQKRFVTKLLGSLANVFILKFFDTNFSKNVATEKENFKME